MTTFLLGVAVFVVAALLLGAGLVLRGHALRGGCHATCDLTEHCPRRVSKNCPPDKERIRE